MYQLSLLAPARFSVPIPVCILLRHAAEPCQIITCSFGPAPFGVPKARKASGFWYSGLERHACRRCYQQSFLRTFNNQRAVLSSNLGRHAVRAPQPYLVSSFTNSRVAYIFILVVNKRSMKKEMALLQFFPAQLKCESFSQSRGSTSGSQGSIG